MGRFNLHFASLRPSVKRLQSIGIPTPIRECPRSHTSIPTLQPACQVQREVQLPECPWTSRRGRDASALIASLVGPPIWPSAMSAMRQFTSPVSRETLIDNSRSAVP